MIAAKRTASWRRILGDARMEFVTLLSLGRAA
jgi:hypothetical protein